MYVTFYYWLFVCDILVFNCLRVESCDGNSYLYIVFKKSVLTSYLVSIQQCGLCESKMVWKHVKQLQKMKIKQIKSNCPGLSKRNSSWKFCYHVRNMTTSFTFLKRTIKSQVKIWIHCLWHTELYDMHNFMTHITLWHI